MFQCEEPIGILGLGISFGDRFLSNEDLVSQFDLNITPTDMENKTGIQSRYFLARDQSLSDIATRAAQIALSDANLSVDNLSRMILATSTPDFLTPSTACVVQHKLNGSGFPCHDISAACSGFVFAVDQALRYLHTGDDYILVIGADARSRTLSSTDVNTVGLYGDGAGAVILGKGSSCDNRIVSSFTYSDGSGYDAVMVPSVGYAHSNYEELGTLSMPSGNRVMKNAIKAMPQVCRKILEKNGLTLSDIDQFIFHQPNLMLLKAIAGRMGISQEKVETSYPSCGNTVAASIPITLHSALDAGRIKRGDRVLLATIGAGFTSGAVLMKWES
ncbi:MAG: ketoacyl-ACP synthase III [Pseudomonadales bacterium]|nr:ketoacyl-ACP synthase III [Pseudomonadales bacterium]